MGVQKEGAGEEVLKLVVQIVEVVLKLVVQPGEAVVKLVVQIVPVEVTHLKVKIN